uniref:Protein RER1 n=1 Tax=Callithrix jacchus TaxID=9483 RepID=A0A5F4WCK1_CALJA
MSEGDSVGESVHGKPSVVYRFFTRLGQIYQSWLDKSTPYTAVRWVVTLGLSFVYMIRVYLLQGWYIVTYALGIYHLNLFIAFLSPKVDPSLMEDSDDGPSLPTKQNEEFRPFIRRLPEFKFWEASVCRRCSCEAGGRKQGPGACRCGANLLSPLEGTRLPRESWWLWSVLSSTPSTSPCSGPSW